MFVLPVATTGSHQLPALALEKTDQLPNLQAFLCHRCFRVGFGSTAATEAVESYCMLQVPLMS